MTKSVGNDPRPSNVICLKDAHRVPDPREGSNMKKLAFVAVVCGMFGMAAPASAGCLGGAAVGAVAGHMMGHHAVAGAAAGCAIGHHSAAKKERAAQQQDQNMNSNH